MNITFKTNESPLSYEQWSFYFNDTAQALILDTYECYQRESKRHKFVSLQAYYASSHRYKYGVIRLLLADVPYDTVIAQKALETFCSTICVYKDFSYK